MLGYNFYKTNRSSRKIWRRKEHFSEYHVEECAQEILKIWAAEAKQPS